MTNFSGKKLRVLLKQVLGYKKAMHQPSLRWLLMYMYVECLSTCYKKYYKHTDHQACQWMLSVKKPSGLLFKWFSEMAT